MFVYNSAFGVNFFAEKIFAGDFFAGTFFFADREKIRKNRKNWNPQKFSATR